MEGSTGYVVQWKACLAFTKPWIPFPALHKPSAAHLCYQVEVGQSGLQGDPWLYCKFKANLGYLNSCVKKQNKKLGIPIECPAGTGSVISQAPQE